MVEDGRIYSIFFAVIWLLAFYNTDCSVKAEVSVLEWGKEIRTIRSKNEDGAI